MPGTRALFVIGGAAAACAASACNLAAVTSPKFADCAQLQALQSAPQALVDSDPLVIRGHAQLSSYFALRGICIRVDGRRAYLRTLEDPVAIHSVFEVPVALRRGEPHQVSVVAVYEGTKGSSGYKFQIESVHDLTSDERSAGALLMHLTEMGDRNTPLEHRPTVRWSAVRNALSSTSSGLDGGPAHDAGAPPHEEDAGM